MNRHTRPLELPQGERGRFTLDPMTSPTLPSRYYTDEAIYRAEMRQIHRKSWCYVGHVCDVAEPGMYFTDVVGEQPMLVVKGHDGEIRAFFNVCQHRGHSLLKGKGSTRQPIVCPYHAWAYGFAGELLAARNCDQVSGFDRDDFALPGILVEDLGGFLFVNLDPEARPMSEVYPGAAEVLTRFCGDTRSLRASRNVLFDIKGNWKNVADNLLECYHCSTAHRAFVDLVKMETYKVELHDYWSVQYGQCRPSNTAYEFAAGDDDGFMTLYLWPTMAFVGLPGTRGVNVFSFSPLDAESTRQDFTYYHPGGEVTATEEASFKYFEDVLGPEDVDLVEDVQVGLNSLGYHQGRIMVDPRRSEISEHALHHFQNLVMRQMGDLV